jgi:hypothetical protein
MARAAVRTPRAREAVASFLRIIMVPSFSQVGPDGGIVGRAGAPGNAAALRIR